MDVTQSKNRGAPRIHAEECVIWMPNTIEHAAQILMQDIDARHRTLNHTQNQQSF